MTKDEGTSSANPSALQTRLIVLSFAFLFNRTASCVATFDLERLSFSGSALEANASFSARE
jgi:hypothetical protein